MIKYIIFLGFLVLAFSCQENEVPMYKEPDAIYFADYNDDADSLNYSFTMIEGKRDTIYIKIQLLGNPISDDKMIPVRVVEEETTAKEGVHYEFMEDILFKTGKGTCMLPIIVKYDAVMDSIIKTLTIELYNDNEFEVGYSDRAKVRIKISNQLLQPSYWALPLEIFFGPYSKVKHKKAVELMGHDFPLTVQDVDANMTYYKLKGRELCRYYAFNECYDENGNRIETWDPL